MNKYSIMQKKKESPIEAIKSFDDKIKEDINGLKEKFKDLKFKFDTEKGIKFILEDYSNECINKIPKGKGVYLFELKKGGRTIDEIKDLWEDPLNEFKKFNSPKIIKKRLKIQEEKEDEWLPLYLGKSETLRQRIKEHIELSYDKGTYALKLQSRTNFNEFEFRISVIEIEIESYDCIMGFIESYLREKYNPIVGKQ